MRVTPTENWIPGCRLVDAMDRRLDTEFKIAEADTATGVCRVVEIADGKLVTKDVKFPAPLRVERPA